MFKRQITHKFRAKQTTVDDKIFPSKLEAKYYQNLKLAQKSGELLFFLRQCPIDLPGKTKLVIDFIEFWKDGTVLFTDCKGIETETFKIKRRQCEEIYPFKLNIVKKA